ncbi:hypothetical protein [Tenacibaculum sp. M341]|uniref:hypothetical protein n=1 Tax=Tenacibaculum sp. M341 TaxID=2530339 RepID=UPI00104494B9|nr:hypothetical protein [Tenacibaculum sp. M341]TCI84924.1 hypothetical protein EYW44_18790 [Tenacibaculum sp. M341]
MKTFVIRLAYVGALLFLIGCTDNSETVIENNKEITSNNLNDNLELSYTDPEEDGTEETPEEE